MCARRKKKTRTREKKISSMQFKPQFVGSNGSICANIVGEVKKTRFPAALEEKILRMHTGKYENV
jgi:hypothetical protein